MNCSGVQSVLGGFHHVWWQCDTDLLLKGWLWPSLVWRRPGFAAVAGLEQMATAQPKVLGWV